MSVLSVIILGIALAMDALGVTLSIGVQKEIKNKDKYAYIFSFGFFQFLFIFIGGFLGSMLNTLIGIPTFVGGIVVFGVGGIMIFDAIKKEEESILLKKGMSIFLGISVSIDALVIGFTLMNTVSVLILFLYSIMVGLITFVICYTGIVICKYIRRIEFIEKYANYFGGTILIIMAIKMIFF
ncbi:MAG: manganese efflux pump MntP family protein [Clostridium sp.]|uniref:manganese efflux pump MntP n=1 Tax=Clostridium sp. TaxID=1506 RepID=UPI003F3C53A7